MRSRASGLGARISSMVLLIALGHRTDHTVDELDFALRDPIFLVESLIGPVLIPVLLRNPAIDTFHGVLTYLPQRHDESDKRGLQVAGNNLRLFLGFKRPGNDPCLRAD